MKDLALNVRRGFGFGNSLFTRSSRKVETLKSTRSTIKADNVDLHTAYTGNFMAGAWAIFHPLLFKRERSK